jgi:hypothetical protein
MKSWEQDWLKQQKEVGRNKAIYSKHITKAKDTEHFPFMAGLLLSLTSLHNNTDRVKDFIKFHMYF